MSYATSSKPTALNADSPRERAAAAPVPMRTPGNRRTVPAGVAAAVAPDVPTIALLLDPLSSFAYDLRGLALRRHR